MLQHMQMCRSQKAGEETTTPEEGRGRAGGPGGEGGVGWGGGGGGEGGVARCVVREAKHNVDSSSVVSGSLHEATKSYT